MTYIREIRELLDACGCDGSIYRTHTAVRVSGKVTPITARDRRRVEKLSTERGYRRFTADLMTNV